MSVSVRVVFERVHPKLGTYRDAIEVPFDEYQTLTPAQIAKLEDDRFKAWAKSVLTASADETPPPTPLERNAQVVEILNSISDSLAQVRDLIDQDTET